MTLFRTTGRLLSAVAFAAFSGIAPDGDASANVILNPSFESGSGTEVDDWLQVAGPSGSTTRDGGMPNSGGFSAYMQVDHFNNPAAPTPYIIEQTQPVGSIDSTLNYDLSFSAKVDTLDFEGIDMFYQILWLDQDASDGGGVRGETLTSLISEGISTSYQTFSLTDIDVPDSADSFQLRFQLSPGAVVDIANGLYIDDVSLATDAVGIPGDFDGDGDVDVDDFGVFVNSFQLSPQGGPPFADGDFDEDGDVDVDDFGVFVNSFQTFPPSAVAIPEPNTAGLLACIGLAAGLRRR